MYKLSSLSKFITKYQRQAEKCNTNTNKNIFFKISTKKDEI
jgi:hypothetical protein